MKPFHPPSRWLGLLGLCLMLWQLPLQAVVAKPRIAAASSLQFALKDLLAEFDPQQRHFAEPVFGASGNLYRQIMQGAPFQLFLSADRELIEKLLTGGRANGSAVTFGHGRLALYKNAGSALQIDRRGSGILSAIERGEVFRIAIANPRHAPYGVAALEALRGLQLEQPLHSRLVFGEKVSQAAMMVRSGAAQAGIISLSLALSPTLAAAGQHVVLAEELHRPLLLQALAIGTAQQSISDFLAFLETPKAGEILANYGVLR